MANVQVLDVSEILDQIPDIISIQDSYDRSASPVEHISTEGRVQGIQETENGTDYF